MLLFCRRHLPPSDNSPTKKIQHDSCNEYVLVVTHLYRLGLVQIK